MKVRFYKFLVTLSAWLGPWVFVLIARIIATGYFMLSPRRRTISRLFYRELFRAKGRFYHLYCTWQQFQNFTYNFMGRLVAHLQVPPHYTIQGHHHLVSPLQAGKGAILLMSHMGNWEFAAGFLKETLPKTNILLYMGKAHKRQIEELQKTDLRQSGIRILGIDEAGGTPFDIMEGVRFLKAGGIVSMTGDRLWREDQRFVKGSLLDHRVRIPQAPFILSLVSGAPIVVFFAFRTGRHSYDVMALPPRQVKAETRGQRQQAIQGAAQYYLDGIRATLDQYPFQWFQFDPFLERRLTPDEHPDQFPRDRL